MSGRPIYHRTEVLAELRREYAWRKRLYPNWVKQGRLRDVDAHRQMQILDQVIQDYARRDMESDLFALRLAASTIAAEVHAIATTHHPDAAISAIADRIAKAIKEGK